MADNKTSIIISAVDQTGAALKSAEAALAAANENFPQRFIPVDKRVSIVGTVVARFEPL